MIYPSACLALSTFSSVQKLSTSCHVNRAYTYFAIVRCGHNSIWANLFFTVAPYFCSKVRVERCFESRAAPHNSHIMSPFNASMRYLSFLFFTCTCQSTHTCAYTTAAGLAPFAYLTLSFAARPLDPCCHLQSQAVQALPHL